MIKVAILSRAEDASPKVLAQTLNEFILQTEHRSEVFYNLKAVRRLSSHSEVGELHGRLPWALYRTWHYLRDRLFFRKLKTFDAVIISECSPSAFLRHSFNIDKLKSRIGGKPVLYYEVYFLGNAPTIQDKLRRGQHHSIEKYDWHLAVSKVTEIRQEPQRPWSHTGLYLKSTGLRPTPKKRLLAVVDFEREGHEEFRRIQIRVLEELAIPYVSLDKRYTIQQIRDIYRQATFFFIQFREAFGIPIAECLCCGCYVLMPDPSWAMSWRLDAAPQVHGPGVMADCFIVYDGADDLRKRLAALKESYDLQATPLEVFATFRQHYPAFYEGNLESLKEILTKLEQHEI